jgi:hypothetical protein
LPLLLADGSILSTTGINIPSGITSFTSKWNTTFKTPGTYSIFAQIKEASSTLLVMSEQRVNFDVTAQQFLENVSITPMPRFSNNGATEQITFRAEVNNRSNVNADLGITFEWRGPDGALLYTGNTAISLLPEERIKSVVLPGLTHKFVLSGDYPLSLRISSGPTPGTISGVPLSVAPLIRIEPSLIISPPVVTPDSDKRIRVDIRLKGVEQK